MPVRVALLLSLCTIAACGGASAPSGTTPTPGDGAVATQPPPSDASTTTPPSVDAGTPPTSSPTASGLAMKLRGKANFLVGLGNDLADNHDNDGAYTLGTTVDLHYAYLVGLQGQGGWPDWNPNGTFVDALFTSADTHGVTPMYTLYAMAASGENNMAALTNDTYMQAYWNGVRLLFQRLAVFGKPAVVHLEPDFWAYAQQYSADGKKAVHVTTLATECAGLTDDFIGMSGCYLALRDKYAPKVAVGLHVSSWGGDVPSTLSFFNALGAKRYDFFVTDVLDRDAGCYEAHTDPNCQRGGTTGWYWDETNTTSPTFHDHLAWVTQMTAGIGLPVMWWQVPLGVPSSTPGGSAGSYRDNRVHYFFSHVDELIAAGGIGMTYGVGAGNQTTITSDGGQFKNAVAKYYAAPTGL